MNAAIVRHASRSAAARGARSFASHAGGKPAHVHMPETAMLTANGTHKFVRKGWEYSTYMGIVGGPIVLYLGLSNAPETDSEFFARCVSLSAVAYSIRIPLVADGGRCGGPSAGRRRSPSAAATSSSRSCAAPADPFTPATCTSGCVRQLSCRLSAVPPR